MSNEATADAVETATNGKKPARIIKMQDGREVDFGVRGRIKADQEITGEGKNRQVNIKFDLESGNSFSFNIDKNFPLILELAAHGARQKIGDSIASTDNPEDADTAVERVIAQLNSGIWIQRSTGEGVGRGFNDLLTAVLECKNIPADSEQAQTLRQALLTKDDDAIRAIRNLPQIKAVIARLVFERTQARAETAAAGGNIDELLG